MVAFPNRGADGMRILLLLLGMALPASLSAQTITTTGPRTPASHSSTHHFTCTVADGQASGEVEIENHRSDSGGLVGELKRLSFRGRDVPEKTMKLIRETIAARPMDIVEPACDHGYVAVMLRVSTPMDEEHARVSWVIITQAKTGEISISDSHG